MKPARRPEEEARRQDALRRYHLLDSKPDRAVDDMVMLAAQICGVPEAAVTLVDDQRVWFKSQYGTTVEFVEREGSFASHSILRTDLFVVNDTATDERFANHRSVVAAPRIRFYAAAPLVTPDGVIIGNLNVIDRVPRQLTELQRSALGVLSRQIMHHYAQRNESADEALRLSDERFQLATRATNDAVWDWNLVNDALWWNEGFTTLFGYSAEEIEPGIESWIGRLHPGDLERVKAGIHSVIESARSAWSDEYRFRRRDGSYAEIFDRGYVIRDHSGRAIRMVGAMIDVTERKRAESRVRHLNRVHAVLSDVSQVILRETDPQAMLTAACQTAVNKGGFLMAWIGISEDDNETHLKIRAHAGADAATLQLVDKLLRHADPDGCPFTHRTFIAGRPTVCNDIATDPGAALWREAALQRSYRAMASLPVTTAGKTVGTFNLYAGEADFFDEQELLLLVQLGQDLSFGLEMQEREAQRRKAEADLRTSEERFRQVVETIREVFWIVDPGRQKILYVSPNFETIWGRPRADLYEVPGTWAQTIHPEDRARAVDAAQVKQVTGQYDELYRIVRPDGSQRWIRDRAFPVRDDGGAVTRVVGTAEDITAQRQLEEQLRQSQKMEAIGQLAGGVAHDFNNILAVIMMQADLAGLVGGLPAEANKYLQDIKGTAERAASLTRQLLVFSRRQVMQPRLVDLNDVVTNLTTMLQRILGEDISLQLNLAARPLRLRADPSMLDQVLLNLVVNARDAMPGGGRLYVHTGMSPDHQICMRVTDTGHGIPPEIRARIFDPFFTTKEPGKGTGLGLATVFGIVQQHGGTIQLESEPGRGATFQILLPPAAAADAPNPEARKPVPRGGTETVLLVEDEPDVRLLTRTVLERYGYRVLEASHGLDALRIWELHPGDIHLLLTDNVMPGGMSGQDLARRLRVRKPQLRVILTSGYSPEMAGRELTLQPGYRFLQKPAPPGELLEVVRECLDSPLTAGQPVDPEPEQQDQGQAVAKY